MPILDGKYRFDVMPPEAFCGAGSVMIHVRQEWPSVADGDTFMRVVIHERDAEELCRQIMAAAAEARRK